MKFEAGQSLRETLRIDEKLVRQFAAFSGDDNPIHLDAGVAKEYGYSRAVAHGGILLAFLSRLIGTKLPGHGAVWMGQSVEWKAPVFVGDEIEVVLTIASLSAAAGVMQLQVSAANQKGELVMEGSGKVKTPRKIGQKSAPAQAGSRVVLVTGASRGIGSEIAASLGRAGWLVGVHFSKSRSEAESLVKRIELDGGKAREIEADLSAPEAAADLVNRTEEEFGRIDAVVHCATPPIIRCAVSELSYDKLEPYLKIYLGGALALIRAAKERMSERGFGRFVFIGTSALFGVPPDGWSAYVTAKGALATLVRCAGTELGPSGITVNMISPSMVVTDLTSDISQRAKEVEARRSPARRLATSEDVADAVQFLIGAGAGYVNGQNIALTGGPI